MGSVDGVVMLIVAVCVEMIVVSTDLLPQTVAAAIDTSAGPQTVVTRMRVFGNTTGGSEVDSAPWDFPIVVAGTPGARPATIPLKPEDCQVAPPPACRPLQANGDALDCRIMNDPYVLQPGFDAVDCNCPQP